MDVVRRKEGEDCSMVKMEKRRKQSLRISGVGDESEDSVEWVSALWKFVTRICSE